LIGTLLTEVNLKEYFTDARFWEYMLNITGYIHYYLPGVFDHNSVHLVNDQLWTVPFELGMYLLISALAFVRLVRIPLLFGIGVLVLSVVIMFSDVRIDDVMGEIISREILKHLAMSCCLWGMFLYLYRHKIPYSGLLCVICMAITWWTFQYSKPVYIATLPIAYFTVYLGLTNPRKIFLISTGDYSYGLYLYGFPIQQVVYQLLPQYRVWYVHFPVSLFLSSICAYLSWTFIESKVLSRKKPALAYMDTLSAGLTAWIRKIPAAYAAVSSQALPEEQPRVKESGRTIALQMEAKGGHTSGFDYLRLVLSLSVIAFHSVLVCCTKEEENLYWEGPLRPLFYFIIPSFFALSGFLVAISMQRVNRILPFLTLRSLRIFPALCCEVTLTALLIGPLFTELPLKFYFSNVRFYEYFLNIIGDIHMALPGIFIHNRYFGLANIQLWTIPYELDCYIIIMILALIGLMRYQQWFGFVTLIFTIGASFFDLGSGRLTPDIRPPEYLTVACYLWGIFFYLNRHKIPYNLVLLSISVAVTWWAFSSAKTSYIAAIPVTYITIYIGLMNPRKIFLVSSGDYSYGLYLYGFPVQQAVFQVFVNQREWYSNFLISAVITGLLAYLSWTFLESKILKRKKQAIAFMDRLAVRISAWIQHATEPPAPVLN